MINVKVTPAFKNSVIRSSTGKRKKEELWDKWNHVIKQKLGSLSGLRNPSSSLSVNSKSFIYSEPSSCPGAYDHDIEHEDCGN